MTTKKLDADVILKKLAELRQAIPDIGEAPGHLSAPDDFPLETAEDFDWAAVAGGLQSLADDLSAVIEQKRAEAEAQALEIYYKAEELSRDPEHAHLIPVVEQMREAYRRDHGCAIPPRGK